MVVDDIMIGVFVKIHRRKSALFTRNLVDTQPFKTNRQDYIVGFLTNNRINIGIYKI